jgi:hypothetical protein
MLLPFRQIILVVTASCISQEYVEVLMHDAEVEP